MNFLKLIKKKTEIKPSDGFDRAFWKKFDSEFSNSAPQHFLKKLFLMPVYSKFAYSMAIVMATGGLWLWTKNANQLQLNPSVESPLVAQVDLLHDLEMFEVLDDVNMSDQDWSVLLPEGEKS